MHVMLVTRTLEIGGAERQLVNLATRLIDEGIRVSVLAFYSGGELKRELDDANIPVFSLNKSGRWDIIGIIWRFLQFVRRSRPDVVYGILNIPNVLILLTRFISKEICIVWRLPASSIDFADYEWGALLADKLEAKLSRFPDIIITNSHAGKRRARTNRFKEGPWQ